MFPPRLLGKQYKAYVYIKRFLHLALDGMPKHKKYTKDAFANDRIWLEKVRAYRGCQSSKRRDGSCVKGEGGKRDSVCISTLFARTSLSARRYSAGREADAPRTQRRRGVGTSPNRKPLNATQPH